MYWLYNKIIVCGQDSFQLILNTEKANVFITFLLKIRCVHISHILFLTSLDQKSVLLIFYECIYMGIVIRQSEIAAL